MPNADCTRNCWIVGGLTGLLVLIFTSVIGPLRWFEGLVLGLVAFGIMGAFLVWLICRGRPAEDAADWHPAHHDTTPAEDMQLQPRGIQSQAAEGFLGAAQSAPTPRVAPSGDAQPVPPASRTDSGRNDIYGGSGDAGQADDLKQIKGVGPKLEELLHDNGVTRFDQIAGWGDAEIDHFADLIGRMGGRIRSDDWVAQARALARGEDTEFSKRVEEGSVY